MDDLFEVNKLILFIAFVIPGFISLKVYELFNFGARKDSSKLLIDAIAFSCVNYALLSWVIFYVVGSGLKENHPVLFVLFLILILFIAPITWALGWTWIRRCQFFQKHAPHPVLKPWDFLFAQRKPYWMIVTLRDGKSVAGLYDENSFASSDPANEQLYLEQEWLLNKEGGFHRPVENSAGILITAHEILTVELFER